MFGKREPPGGAPKIEVTDPRASAALVDFTVPFATADARSNTTIVTRSFTLLALRSDARSPSGAPGVHRDPLPASGAVFDAWDSRISLSIGDSAAIAASMTKHNKARISVLLLR
jgi:hypothetical protein